MSWNETKDQAAKYRDWDEREGYEKVVAGWSWDLQKKKEEVRKIKENVRAQWMANEGGSVANGYM